MEQWTDASSNSEQQYLTHGVFRYFGKLPPTLTRRILDELNVGPETTVADVMCGSGTTLIETVMRGATTIGIDCNDLSVLISKVKTTPIARDQWLKLERRFVAEFSRYLTEPKINGAAGLINGKKISGLNHHFEAPKIVNIDHWFDKKSVELLCLLRTWVEKLDNNALGNLAKLAFVSSIRPCSRASVRTGRLFRDLDKVLPHPMVEFSKRLKKIGEAVSTLLDVPNWTDVKREIYVADARETGLPGEVADVVFCHPPYFALYRYSSDVLRFELDWIKLSRKKIADREIEDGFKTSDETLVNEYIADMEKVAAEARRIAKRKSKFVIVNADSTLRKKRLLILDPIIELAAKHKWKLTRRIVRNVRFAQASYHRSYDAEIQRPDDEILIFEAG